MRSTLKIGLIAFSVRARRAVPLPVVFCAFALTAAPLANADELGRLFFTPEQRAQLDYNYAREARPEGSGGGSMTLNGIVQKHGGKRTIWINGVPQQAGSSDDKTPESTAVAIPGQNKSVKLKVGQRVLLSPSAGMDTTKQNSSNAGSAEQNASDD